MICMLRSLSSLLPTISPSSKRHLYTTFRYIQVRACLLNTPFTFSITMCGLAAMLRAEPWPKTMRGGGSPRTEAFTRK